jgi:hypothetical protein
MPTNEIKPKAPEPQKAHESEGSTPAISPVQSDALGDYARDLAFMEEEIEVCLAPPISDQDTTRLVGPIVVNGIGQYFVRGQWTKTKRKFLEVLLDAKTEHWTFSYKRSPTGDMIDTQFSIQSGRFALAGVRDQNPQGLTWMQQVQQRQV